MVHEYPAGHPLFTKSVMVVSDHQNEIRIESPRVDSLKDTCFREDILITPA